MVWIVEKAAGLFEEEKWTLSRYQKTNYESCLDRLRQRAANGF